MLKSVDDYHDVLCLTCEEKDNAVIRMAEYMIPVRKLHYAYLKDQSGIDKRLMGACSECVDSKNKFQRDRKKPVDADNKHLVYSLDE